MKSVALILVTFVAMQHLGFMILEMFFWTEPLGLRTFGLTQAFANESAGLAMNQGLYNGFLAAGLLWSVVRQRDATALKVFFLSCVIVAGIFGGITVKSSIFFVQGVPAIFALAAVLLSRPRRNTL